VLLLLLLLHRPLGMARRLPTTAERRRRKQQSVCERDDVEFQTRITLCISYKRKLVNRLLVYGGITADWRLLNISRLEWRLPYTGWVDWRLLNISRLQWRLLYTGWVD
jgi:hypothetical protein